MPIFELSNDRIRPIKETSFAEAGITERGDLQRLLREQIEIISPDTLVIAEEFGHWEESRRRIDLLGIDRDANLVVIELKRTDDGGHMDLQAIRYAAMVSVMSFDDAVEAFRKFLSKNNRNENAREEILKFLDGGEVNEDEFAQRVRIVLASAEFSKELTTSVLWLNNHDLDITCVRLRPYQDQDRIFLDVQQVIPIPEAEAYQVKVRQKQERERASRRSGRRRTKYDVTTNGETFVGLSKRRAIFHIVKHLCDNGVSPEDVEEVVDSPGKLFRSLNGDLGTAEFQRVAHSETRSFDPIRFFLEDNELIHANRRTYAFTNQWGKQTLAAMRALVESFPDKQVDWRPTDE